MSARCAARNLIRAASIDACGVVQLPALRLSAAEVVDALARIYGPEPSRSSGSNAKAAPFKRNDVLPIGVMVFPGTGIQDNLADKARKLGIPVWRFGKSGA